jgi:UDP-N-acetylglucosamine diphosphorylase/glucosamine-1-phosphate N-acetyltransferase
MADFICIFEGTHCERLHPLVYMRPVYDLRCGMETLRRKIERCYPGLPAALHCRAYLAPFVRAQNPGLPVNDLPGSSGLFVNGRVIADSDLAARIPPVGQDTLYVDGETVIAARVGGEKLLRLKNRLGNLLDAASFDGLVKEEITARAVRYPWDLVAANGTEIAADAAAIPPRSRGIRGTVFDGAHLVHREAITIGEGSTVKPGAVLDAEHGPIVIGNGVTVMSNAVIEGPASIGDFSTIKVGAKIYGNTSIGPVCKVGGEVEASVIHSHSNKQHDGYLGHSYLAMWVNLGAGTNNSDLKNNYGHVHVIINGETVDTGSMFVGLTMGDHAKSAISTVFNTGTVVGLASNVFGAGFPPKYVPSFAWGGADLMTTYDLERALQVAKRVMARRKTVMLPEEEAVYRHVFEATRGERLKAGLPD